MSEDSHESVSKRQRLTEVYRRLAETPRCSSADDALSELGDVVEQVENALSGVAMPVVTPHPSVTDGRMYRPLEAMSYDYRMVISSP
jgi:hypothetical protein